MGYLVIINILYAIYKVIIFKIMWVNSIFELIIFVNYIISQYIKSGDILNKYDKINKRF